MKKFCCFLLFSLAVLPIIGQNTTNSWDSKETASISKEVQFQRLLDSSDVYYTKGDYRKDLSLNFELLKLAFEINEPYYLHKGYRNLAYDYLVLGDTISAKESFEKSEKQAHLSMNDTVSAHIYMDLANVYSFTENSSEKAIEYHEKSIELFEKLNDSVGLAKAHYNTILTALETDDFNRAYVHIIKAKKYIEYGDTSYATALECLLGQYYHFKGKYEMANTYLLSTIALSRNNNDLVLLEDAYYYYSENLLKQEKFKEAYNARVKYEEYLEANQQKIIFNEVEAASMNYQVAEFRKDVEIAETENLLQAEIVRAKSRLNTILIFIAAGFILLFFALFLAHRNRKKLVRELKIKNKEYLLAKEESEKFTKAKSKFFSTVSHELRTPLYGVIGLSSLLLEDKSLKKHEQELKSLKFSADYLLALINDVLQINKLDANNLEDDQSAFNLRDLTRKISSSFEYMRLQNKNRIHLHISESIPQYICGNSIRLSQILMNLIGNACKFTEEGDIYLIAENVDAEDGKLGVKFYVKDTGIGIPKEKQECIFDEFSQVNSTNYTYQGTGLGLPIVKKLLNLSNSNIHLDSEFGKGSIFSFILTFEKIEQVVEKKDTAILDTSILNGKKILIVEDNRINQMVTKKILEKNNIECTIAENGAEAINIVREESFDLILMDINMPLKNGIEATKEIRLFDTTTPIVALTAVEIEEMRHSIYESGMNDIIVKPYDITKFIQTILRSIALKENLPLPRTTRLKAV